MKKQIKDTINKCTAVLIAIIISGLMLFFFVWMISGCQEQRDNTTYEFEIIEKYEKLGSRFLSGSETEYRVIYKDRRLYKGEPDSEWRTYDKSIRYDQYRNLYPGYHFKGKTDYFFTYDFN